MSNGQSCSDRCRLVTYEGERPTEEGGSTGRRLLLLVTCLFPLFFGACGSLKLSVQSEVPHRDAEGKPLPVVVRLYQLSDKERFQKGDFLSLARSDHKVLEKDILWRKEITLFPNSELVLKEERKKGAEYFGVMALFREKGKAWRQVVDLNKLWTLSVKIKIREREIIVD
ncbi:MAG: hypothetical protein NBKEAIPA_02986 [Nitrospirae bacterium]|nr:hypothetical protein [Nitrospirota bacterium]QOJ33790.1 MAG: type VI secretion system lipoprotein TssJ [Nitrospira sp.]